jgi:nifR3 family TIM-barrel protein
VKKVVRSGAGSALLRDPERVRAILAAVRPVYPGPLTIKIRSGWEKSALNYLDIGRIAEDAGLDGVTLHPRSRCQGFSGQADWELIARLKTALQIPVFGSGDIFSATDGLNMLEQTGCDAIMIGRGGYGNPWLIRQILDRLQGKATSAPTTTEIRRTALTHLQLHEAQFGSRKALLEMRKHLCWYARGLSGASHFRAAVQMAESLDQVRALIDQYFQQAEAV